MGNKMFWIHLFSECPPNRKKYFWKCLWCCLFWSIKKSKCFKHLIKNSLLNFKSLNLNFLKSEYILKTSFIISVYLLYFPLFNPNKLNIKIWWKWLTFKLNLRLLSPQTFLPHLSLFCLSEVQISVDCIS